MNLINRVYKTSDEYSEDFINRIIEELNKIPNACIEKILGNIKKIDIDLTLDLYNGVTLPNDILYYTKIEAQHIISNINIENIPSLIYFMSDNAKEYVLASISKGNRKYIEKKISTNSLINEKVDEEYKESIKQYRREIYKSIKFINTITDVKKQKGIAFLEKINSDKIKEINDLIAEEIKKRKEVLSYYILQGYKDELIFLKNYLGENNTYTNISFVKQTFESLLNKDEFLFSKNDYKYFSEYKKYLKKIDIEKLKFFFEQIENIDIDLYEFFSHLLIEVKDITYLCDLDCSKLYSYYCDTNYLLFKFYDKNETVKNKMLRNFSWVKNDYEIVSEKDIKEFEENLIKEMLKHYLNGDIQFLDNNEI